MAIKVSAAEFEPSRLALPQGKEAHLAFIRLNAANCAREVVFPDLGIRVALPPGETTLVTIPASQQRELHFACGMGMYHGTLLIR